MTFNIFKSVDSDFISAVFRGIFPNEQIKKIEIEKKSPDWAKATCLVRYRITFDGGKEIVVRGSAKTHHSKKPVFKIMEYLYGNGLNSGEFLISHPLAHIKEANLLLYEEAPGFPLVSSIELKKNMKKNMIKAAEWLSILHKIPLKPNLPKAEYGGSYEYGKILDKIKQNIPEIKGYLFNKKRLNFLDNVWAKENKSLIHNDFYPGNSIVGKKSFYGIDFDKSGVGPSLMDVAALYSFFDFPKQIWKSGMKVLEKENIQKIFLERYCKLNNLDVMEIRKRIKPFIVKSFFDQINYYVSFFMKGRRYMNQSERNNYIGKNKALLITISKLKI